jgi:hypothetical protein
MAGIYLAYNKESLLANVDRALYNLDTIEVSPARPYEPSSAPAGPRPPMMGQYPASAVPQPTKPREP